MADDIRVNLSAILRLRGKNVRDIPVNMQFTGLAGTEGNDPSGQDYIEHTVTVGSTWQQVDIGQVGGDAPYFFIHNQDEGSSIEFGGGQAQACSKLSPGEFLFNSFVLPLYGKADAGSVDILLIAIGE